MYIICICADEVVGLLSYCKLLSKKITVYVALKALTSTADVDVQIAFDDGTVFQRLSSIHRVYDWR